MCNKRKITFSKIRKLLLTVLQVFNIFSYIPVSIDTGTHLIILATKKEYKMNSIHLVWQNSNYTLKSFAYFLRNILLQNREYKMNLMQLFLFISGNIENKIFCYLQKAGQPSKNGIKEI